MMYKPDHIKRYKLGEYLANAPQYDGPGVYVLACYPSLGCVYVGMADNVYQRIVQHMAGDDRLGQATRTATASVMMWRLDILVPPIDTDWREWMRQAERAAIWHFRPLLNEQGLGGA